MLIFLRRLNCTLGDSEFHNLMGFTSKKRPKNILKNICEKKFFNWFSHFLRNCILIVPRNTHTVYVFNDPKFFYISFFAYEYQKCVAFYADFKSVKIIEKVHPEKVICLKLLQVSIIKEDKLQFCTLFLPKAFLWANLLYFSQQFWNQRKILRSFNTKI